MFRKFFKQVFSMPTIKLPKINVGFPTIKIPSVSIPTVSMPSIKLPTIVIPVTRITTVLGAINTMLLVAIGGIGLFISYINPIPTIISARPA